MKTIKNSKDITTLEVGDVVMFGDSEYIVDDVFTHNSTQYYLYYPAGYNGIIFEKLNLKKRDFVEKLGIDADYHCDFPETKSLEALTAIVSALYKEYEKQKELPKTWEEFCERNKMGDKRFCLYHGDIIGTGVTQNIVRDTILVESIEEAQAFRALMQLRQLRKAYVKDWEPDLTKACFGIVSSKDGINITSLCTVYRNLSFPTYELVEQFLTNFKDLLEIAKPLL